jgi:hypothetical protein
MPVILDDAVRTAEVILAFEERYKDIGYQVCKVLSRTISGTGSYENPEKMKSVAFVSGARLCHECKMTTNNFFLCGKRMARESPKCSI